MGKEQKAAQYQADDGAGSQDTETGNLGFHDGQGNCQNNQGYAGPVGRQIAQGYESQNQQDTADDPRHNHSGVKQLNYNA